MNLYQKKGEYGEMEYIAREALLEQLKAMESYNASPMYRRGYDDCVEVILKTPAADVVPVVRCKDCENAYINSSAIASGIFYCSTNMRAMLEDDFCSYGERRDGGADNETD